MKLHATGGVNSVRTGVSRGDETVGVSKCRVAIGVSSGGRTVGVSKDGGTLGVSEETEGLWGSPKTEGLWRSPRAEELGGLQGQRLWGSPRTERLWGSPKTEGLWRFLRTLESPGYWCSSETALPYQMNLHVLQEYRYIVSICLLAVSVYACVCACMLHVRSDSLPSSLVRPGTGPTSSPSSSAGNRKCMPFMVLCTPPPPPPPPLRGAYRKVHPRRNSPLPTPSLRSDRCR